MSALLSFSVAASVPGIGCSTTKALLASAEPIFLIDVGVAAETAADCQCVRPPPFLL